MGRDKSRLRFGQRTLLQHIRAEAKRTGLTVRVIKHDIVPRCGPLGGIYTALKRSRARAILFLPCDMPLLESETLHWAFKQFEEHRASRKTQRNSSPENAFFFSHRKKAGFPFILPKTALHIVQRQIAARQFSLQSLARTLHTKIIQPPRLLRSQLQNLNTPEDFSRARKLWSNLQNNPTGRLGSPSLNRPSK